MFFTHARPQTRASPPRPTFRPRLEYLEDRTVLAPTTTTLTLVPNPATAGQAVTLTATVTGGIFTPGSWGGSVTFRIGSNPLGTVAVTPGAGQGVATFATSGLGTGGYFFTAQYNGETDPIFLFVNDPSTSAPVVLVVNAPPAPPPPIANVAALVSTARVPIPGQPNGRLQLVTLRNNSGQTVQGPLFLILRGLRGKVRLRNASGLTRTHGKPGDPFVIDTVTLHPGGEVTLLLRFSNPRQQRIRFTMEVLAGTGEV